jgi:hypothetical protein
MSRQLTPLLFVFSTFCVASLMTRIALVEDGLWKAAYVRCPD